MISDDELAGYERTAGVFGLTLSSWVRRTLEQAQREVATGDVDAKLEAIRRAATYAFPAPDIEQMLAETERGYQLDQP